MHSRISLWGTFLTAPSIYAFLFFERTSPLVVRKYAFGFGFVTVCDARILITSASLWFKMRSLHNFSARCFRPRRRGQKNQSVSVSFCRLLLHRKRFSQSFTYSKLRSKNASASLSCAIFPRRLSPRAYCYKSPAGINVGCGVLDAPLTLNVR